MANDEVISKDDILFERDENGKLIPQKVQLEITDDMIATNPELEDYKGKYVWVTPITRGEFKKLLADIGMNRTSDNTEDEHDFDADLVLKHCIQPKIEKDDLPYLKPGFISAVVDCIFKISGLSSGKGKQDKFNRAETEFKKN